MLTNSQKCVGTFQLFTDAIKITNFWSQQHNLILEILLYIVTLDSYLHTLSTLNPNWLMNSLISLLFFCLRNVHSIKQKQVHTESQGTGVFSKCKAPEHGPQIFIYHLYTLPPEATVL